MKFGQTKVLKFWQIDANSPNFSPIVIYSV